MSGSYIIHTFEDRLKDLEDQIESYVCEDRKRDAEDQSVSYV